VAVGHGLLLLVEGAVLIRKVRPIHRNFIVSRATTGLAPDRQTPQMEVLRPDNVLVVLGVLARDERGK